MSATVPHRRATAAELEAVQLEARTTESPDWPTVFHPPGVVRLITPAEQAAMHARAGVEPQAPK